MPSTIPNNVGNKNPCTWNLKSNETQISKWEESFKVPLNIKILRNYSVRENC